MPHYKKDSPKKASVKTVMPNNFMPTEVIKVQMEKPARGERKQEEFKNLMLGKKAAKGEFYNNIESEEKDLRTPLLLIMATDLNGKKELIDRELLYKILQGCSVLNLKTVVLDNLEKADKHEHLDQHITWINPQVDFAEKGSGPKEVDKLLLAADMALVFHEEQNLVKLLTSYGVIVIGEEKSPLLENYHPNEESGNSFTFTNTDAWAVFATLVRAVETHKFPYDWQHIIRNGLKG